MICILFLKEKRALPFKDLSPASQEGPLNFQWLRLLAEVRLCNLLRLPLGHSSWSRSDKSHRCFVLTPEWVQVPQGMSKGLAV